MVVMEEKDERDVEMLNLFLLVVEDEIGMEKKLLLLSILQMLRD